MCIITTYGECSIKASGERVLHRFGRSAGEWGLGRLLYRVGPLELKVVSSVCGDQLTFVRRLLVGRDLADAFAFGLIMPCVTVSLVFRYCYGRVLLWQSHVYICPILGMGLN